jgi:hypothetical protein
MGAGAVNDIKEYEVKPGGPIHAVQLTADTDIEELQAYVAGRYEGEWEVHPGWGSYRINVSRPDGRGLAFNGYVGDWVLFRDNDVAKMDSADFHENYQLKG